MKSMFDGETWFDIAVPEVPVDPLKFRDERRYIDRLKDARGKTSTNDAIKLGYGKLDGLPVVIGGAGFRFHGRLARHGGRRGGDQGSRNRRRQGHALHHVRGLRRRAHAGRNSVADAAAAHHGGCAAAARGRQALSRGADQSDHRRRHGVVCHARRHPYRGARRAHRLRRAARDRADHPGEAAGRIPACRISEGARHGGHGRAPPSVARDALQPVPAAHQGPGAVESRRPPRPIAAPAAPPQVAARARGQLQRRPPHKRLRSRHCCTRRDASGGVVRSSGADHLTIALHDDMATVYAWRCPRSTPLSSGCWRCIRN